MTSTNYTHHPRGYFTQTSRMVPLAPAPCLPASYAPPQPNVPVAQEAAPAPPQDGDLTSDLHFPVRLHYMLTDIHKEGIYTNIVSWQPHGRYVNFVVLMSKRQRRRLCYLSLTGWFCLCVCASSDTVHLLLTLRSIPLLSKGALWCMIRSSSLIRSCASGFASPSGPASNAR